MGCLGRKAHDCWVKLKACQFAKTLEPNPKRADDKTVFRKRLWLMQAPWPRNWNSSGTFPDGRITEKFGKDNSARQHDNGCRQYRVCYRFRV